MSGCKCPKSEGKADEPRAPYFEDITMMMEERRCDLLGRQKYLRDKITTMERSIPALIAYNMWMSKKCDNAPYCKVREIMRRFSSYPDPTDKLLNELKRTVKELNGETAELHEKIIQADIKLEETDMELESLELVNKEMSNTLNSLEKEVRSYTTPSLHSIHSEDLICLSKVRQLAKEELNLKNCIKELEQRESIFKEHMDRLLMSKEYQSVCGRRKINCAEDLECNAMNICCVPRKCLLHLANDYRSKKKQAQQKIDQSDAVVSTSEQNINEKKEAETQQEKMEKRTSWIPNWWKNNDNAETVPSQTKSVTLSNAENNENEGSATRQPNSTKETQSENTNIDKPPKQSKSKFSTPSCEPCGHSPCPPTTSAKSPRSQPHTRPREFQNIAKRSCTGKIASCIKQSKGFPRGASLRKGCCELPSCANADHGARKSCKSIMPPCDLRSLCEICPSPCADFLRSRGNCRCNCRGKCAQGLSDAECNCSDALDPSEGYRPVGSKQLDMHTEDSNSEDEFCECCSCGCEDSDTSLPCQCN